MTNQNSQVHYTTPAEATIMEAIDTVINNQKAGDLLPDFDFDFLRDYTVWKMQTKLFQLGYHNYTAQACSCVHASRYYYRDRRIAQLNFTHK